MMASAANDNVDQNNNFFMEQNSYANYSQDFGGGIQSVSQDSSEAFGL